ncbi:MAG: transporter substrate-binding domain-containing protein [Rhizobiales bacterium]|nr:transporter substrate-binding domain-containing protein [Hyphomicrobiales bacterium]
MRALISAAILLAVSQASGLAQATKPELAPQGKLRAALVGSNPVLVTKMPDGTLTGVSVDLGKLIAEKFGVPFEPVVYGDTDAYAQSFGKGAWDVAIGPRTPVAEAACDFSPDFMLVDNIYVAAPGRDFADAHQVDRPGVKIAVVLNGAPDQFLSKSLKSAELVRIRGGRNEMIEALRSGKADLYGSNAENVQAVFKGLPGAKILPGAFRSVRMAVAVPKGLSKAAQEKLAAIVTDAKQTGVVQKAIDKGVLKGVRVAPN